MAISVSVNVCFFRVNAKLFKTRLR